METSLGGFGDLLQQAQQLTADMDSGLELPRFDRNLSQLRDAAVRMSSRVPLGSQDTASLNASLLLGRSYDVQKISQNLECLTSAKTFEPLEAVRDTDIHGFLKNERENALLTAIDQARKNTFEQTERRHWESMESEWEREKQRILNALIGYNMTDVDLPLDAQVSQGKDVSMQGAGGRTMLDSVEMAYSQQVYVYNEQLIHGGVKASLVNSLHAMAGKLDDQNVSELWSVVKHMVDVSPTTSCSARKQRQSPKMMTAFVQQALKYLEQSYVKYITTSVYRNLKQAELGGVPGTYNLVRSFLNIHLTSQLPGLEDGEVDGHPVWALIYYCIRCGNLEAASNVISHVQQSLDDFPQFFQEYVSNESHRLTVNSEREIRLKYKSSVRNSTDPFKRVCYCIVGRCDHRDDHGDIVQSTDDYLWLKLQQLSDDGGDSSGASQHDQLTFSQLQVLLREEYGESHFQAYQQPFLYFRVLFLTAQFEAALEFLSRMEAYRCHAVHVALVLHELGLLLTPDSIQAQLLSKDSSDPEALSLLNLSRLVMIYTRKFEITDPREVLQYFYFLRDFKTSQGENLFMNCVSELVVESREFDLLLGQMNKDGSRRPGAIDKFGCETQKIIELVAKNTEGCGLMEEAVKLYDLAKNTDKVLEILTKLLSQVVSQPSAPQSNKDRLKQTACNMAQRYRELGLEAKRHTTNTFYLLLDLMTFFDLYHGKKLEQALKVIQDLNILPFTQDVVEQKVSAFRNFSDEVRRSLPEVLLATMNILHLLYKNTKVTSTSLVNHGFGKIEDGGKQSYVAYLRSQARALIMFSGMLPYRMPGDTNARLVQLEVLMN